MCFKKYISFRSLHLHLSPKRYNSGEVIAMILIMEQVLLLMLFAVAGYALCKTGKADAKNAKLLSTLEVYIFLPATYFNTFLAQFNPQYLGEKYSLILGCAVILTAEALAAFGLARLLTKDRYQRSVFQYSLTVPNYGYMGFALAGGIFGQEMLLNVMVFAMPVSLFTYTIGYCLLTKSRISLKKLLNPVMISMLCGAAAGFFGLSVPSVFAAFLTKAAACMAPVSMLLTGMAISEYPLRSLITGKTTYIVAVLRLLVIPCTAAAALTLLKLEHLIIPALMVLAMPCGLNTIVFPKLVGEDCRSGASLAFITNLLCCITIPVCLFLFGGTA